MEEQNLSKDVVEKAILLLKEQTNNVKPYNFPISVLIYQDQASLKMAKESFPELF